MKNIKSKKTPQDVQDLLSSEESSAFALFWNMFQAVAPSEVLDNFDIFLSTLEIC
jgi:hypothetical protein